MNKTLPRHFICCLALFFLSSAFSGWALEVLPTGGPFTIEAERISYDRGEDIYRASGQVSIVFSGGTLQADSVQLAKGSNTASAEGRVKVRTGNDILEGDKVDFDLTTNTGVLYSGKMFIARSNFYLKGNKIEKSGEATYRIHGVSLTTCDGELPDWRLTARDMDVTVDGYGKLSGGKFFANDVPLLYLPYFIFPAKTTRQTGFLFPRLAYSRVKLGWDAELPFYLAISNSADATFYQRYMDKRGFKEGAEFRYFLNKDSYGTIYGDYLHDTAQITEQAGTLSRNWQTPQNRWSFYLQNYTALQPGLYLRADIAKVSDNWYFRDFASYNYYQEHYALNPDERFKRVSFTADESLAFLESKVRLVKDWSSYNLTALMSYTDNLTSDSNGATLQKYPEITLNGARQAFFGTPVNFALNASYSGNYRQDGSAGNLVDVKPVFSLPLDFGGIFSLVPEAGVRGSFWERNDNYATDDTRRGQQTSYRLGLTATTSFLRDFALPGRAIMDRIADHPFEKIRHEIKPELIYAYVPYVDQADMPDFAEVINEQHVVTAAMTNTLVAKWKGKNGATNYQEVLRFKLAQRYDIKEARRDVGGSDAARRPFGAIDMELDLKPAALLAFYVRNRLNVNSGRWEKSNYDLKMTDTRGDTLSLGYRYTIGLLEEINLSLRAFLTKSPTPFLP
ncbi:MAG: LPS assembly protein LptD [Syntrophales bacterium LBB04]|nr:LPS assembly protein LptD [Syntrophales bacterium LBB04]